jgi:3-phytase
MMNVSPKSETVSLSGSGDVADDPAIWIHPADPSLSAVIGTNKDGANGGLVVFDLNGGIVDTAASGQAMNNVDLRYSFNLGGSSVDLIGASNRTTDSLDFFTIDRDDRELHSVGSVSAQLSGIYGFAMHQSKDGDYYAFVSNKDGQVRQFELDGSSGKVTATAVRTLKVGDSEVEGMVADDQSGALYIGEENTGIWKYGADPASGAARTAVDKVGNGNLTADVEGMSIYYGPNGTGYLIASSQGDSTYALYDRADDNDYIGSFRIVDGNGIDGASSTDGLDVTNVPLNVKFPKGMLVVHDGNNTDGTTSNFKFISWDDIATPNGLDAGSGTGTTNPPSDTPQRVIRNDTSKGDKLSGAAGGDQHSETLALVGIADLPSDSYYLS